MEELVTLEKDINLALVLLERDWPVELFVITSHIVRHIIEDIRKFGPVHMTWMYMFERLNSSIGRRALSRVHPEATVMSWFQVSFSSFSLLSCFRGKSKQVAKFSSK